MCTPLCVVFLIDMHGYIPRKILVGLKSAFVVNKQIGIGKKTIFLLFDPRIKFSEGCHHFEKGKKILRVQNLIIIWGVVRQ